MTAPKLEFDIRGLLDARKTLDLMALPASKRRRLLNTCSKRLRTPNRKRIREQRNLDGTPFTKRKGGGKRRMLQGLGKRLQVVSVNADEAVLGWKNRLVSRIASEHQRGQAQMMTAARMRRLGKQPVYSDPASRRQARALLNAGYQIRQGKRWKRPSQRWIVDNLRSGQAGVILSGLTGAQKKQSWKIDLPPRAVLGATQQDVRDIVNTVLEQTFNAPR
jgi:hypothetical protein